MCSRCVVRRENGGLGRKLKKLGGQLLRMGAELESENEWSGKELKKIGGRPFSELGERGLKREKRRGKKWGEGGQPKGVLRKREKSERKKKFGGKNEKWPMVRRNEREKTWVGEGRWRRKRKREKREKNNK